jgi:translation elongation factor EF-G
MFGYIGNLRGMSQGRAQFTMQYDHYEAVPQWEPPDDTFPQAAAMRA